MKSTKSKWIVSLSRGPRRAKWQDIDQNSPNLSTHRFKPTIISTWSSSIVLRVLKARNKLDTATCRNASESFSSSNKDWKRVNDGTEDYSPITKIHQLSLYQMPSWSTVSTIWATETSEISWDLTNTFQVSRGLTGRM